MSRAAAATVNAVVAVFILIGCSSSGLTSSGTLPKVPPPGSLAAAPGQYTSVTPFLTINLLGASCMESAKALGDDFDSAVDLLTKSASAQNQLSTRMAGWYLVDGSHLWADIAEHDISSGSDPAFYLTATAVTAQAWDKANGGANCVGGDTFWQAFTAELSETTISSVENSRSIGIPDGGASKLHSFFMAMVKASSG